jgi:hypothetical protein
MNDMQLAHAFLEKVHKKERSAIIREGVLENVVLPYAAVVDIETIRDTPTVLRGKYPCFLDPLKGVKAGKAMVQHCPTLDYRFLWCHVDNGSYRKHYLQFLRTHHGWHGHSISDKWHVDHVFNRARARRLQVNWIRMVLLPRSVNTSHGAGYERGRTGSKITGMAGRDHTLDEVTLSKISGLKSPRRGQPPSAELLSYARLIGRLHGLNEQAVLGNVSDLLDI